MALMTFTVTPDEGDEFEVEAGSRDLARWESEGKGRSLAALGSNPSMAEMYRVCWIAMERLSNAGKLDLPAGVTDVKTLQEVCDITSKIPEGMEAQVAAHAGAMGWAGGAYPPGR